MAGEDLHGGHFLVGQFGRAPQEDRHQAVVALSGFSPRAALAVNDHDDTVEGRTDKVSLLTSSVSAHEQRARNPR